MKANLEQLNYITKNYKTNSSNNNFYYKFIVYKCLIPSEAVRIGSKRYNESPKVNWSLF